MQTPKAELLLGQNIYRRTPAEAPYHHEIEENALRWASPRYIFKSAHQQPLAKLQSTSARPKPLEAYYEMFLYGPKKRTTPPERNCVRTIHTA